MTTKINNKQELCSTPAKSPNNKHCAQCDIQFKKSQKSMNCNICNHWFCLDCSNISNSLYEALRKEPTPNLPFNCDGCTRVLPKLTELGAIIQNQKTEIETFKEKIKDLESTIDEKVAARVDQALESFREREERKCNIIVHNIPEPKEGDKKSVDTANLNSIFETIGCQDVKVKSFVRLGRPSEKNRLVKVVLESVTDKHKILGGAKILRKRDDNNEYMNSKWSNLFITPDLTKEERDKNRELRFELERRKKDEKNPNLVIFRGKIVQRQPATTGNPTGGRPFPGDRQ